MAILQFDDTTKQVHFDQNATFSIDLQLGNFCSSGIDFAKQQKNCCQTLRPFSSQNLRLSSRNFHRPQDSSSSGVSFNTVEKNFWGESFERRKASKVAAKVKAAPASAAKLLAATSAEELKSSEVGGALTEVENNKSYNV